jgi:hypothetical protein
MLVCLFPFSVGWKLCLQGCMRKLKQFERVNELNKILVVEEVSSFSQTADFFVKGRQVNLVLLVSVPVYRTNLELHRIWDKLDYKGFNQRLFDAIETNFYARPALIISRTSFLH